MTAVEVYDNQGRCDAFARLIAACEEFGPYCLIGGLAVNCYVEPVYTIDADLVIVSPNLESLSRRLRTEGYRIEEYAHLKNTRIY